MNPAIAALRAYPFERLTALVAGVAPPAERSLIRLSIGEPRHAPPPFVQRALEAALPAGLGAYPATKGSDALRSAIGDWAERRWSLPRGSLDRGRAIIPCNGTREGLHAFIHAVIDPGRSPGPPVVVMPNPYYQIYEGGALLSGAEPYFAACRPELGWAPDLDSVPESVWRRCQLLVLCTPGNPTGAVHDLAFFERALALADRYDFVVASDECYGEIYDEAPPLGLLEACVRLGRSDFARCAVFESLSKRSSLPGLRSGFVAGDVAIMDPLLVFRTYHGSAMPQHVQAASEVAWRDEAHVDANRALYRAKFDAVMPLLEGMLDVERPAGSFFMWAGVPGGDAEQFTRELFAREHVLVLPGEYLSQRREGYDPGAGRVRIAWVEPVEVCVEAARRIARVAEAFSHAASARRY